MIKRGSENTDNPANQKPALTSFKKFSEMDDVEDNVVSNDAEAEKAPVENKPKDMVVKGKVAKIKNTKSGAKQVVETVKNSRNMLWYVLVEKQDSELKMIKCKGDLNMTKFVNELKSYYTKTYSKDLALCEKINRIEIVGDQKITAIKNVPSISINGISLLQKITEDLIELLA
jgi:hypothetical protein